MRGDAAFAVPRDRRGVTVRLDGGAAIEGEIFLEYMHADLSIHQKVTMFLENDSVFFPLKVDASGGTDFISKKKRVDH